MRGLVGIHMRVVWVWHTCVLVWRTTVLPRHSYSTVCLRMRVCVCVCVKRDSPATKKCFHLSCQPHTSFGCVAGTLWSLRSPQMIQEPTVIQPPLFGRKEMEHRKRIIGEEWVGWELWLWESWSDWEFIGTERGETERGANLRSFPLCSFSESSSWDSCSSLRLFCSLETKSTWHRWSFPPFVE